jgi:hypothetical protein
MSDTIVDMAKVTQALDAGWIFRIFKNSMGTYCVIAEGNDTQMSRLAKRRIIDTEGADVGSILDDDGECTTDDFTPEQALTRAAYKVHGEILP